MDGLETPDIHTLGARVCILWDVRRINIYIDEDLDRRAETEARRRKISKAALIRQSLLAVLGTASDPDPLDALVGMSDAESVEDIDSVIYDR
jgi:hypothetical protein